MTRKFRIKKQQHLAGAAGVRLWQHHIDFIREVVARDPEQSLNRLARRGFDLLKLEMDMGVDLLKLVKEGRVKILDAPSGKK